MKAAAGIEVRSEKTWQDVKDMHLRPFFLLEDGRGIQA
jgi:hypothetical protein